MLEEIVRCYRAVGRVRFALGVLGILMALSFMAWLLLGWIGWVPSMIDYYGIIGMRTPVSVLVAGLLVAAIAFWEY